MHHYPSTISGSEEGFIRNDNRGTVYTGEGTWVLPLRANDDNKSWTRGSKMINQFKWIFIDENNIKLRTIRVDNADSLSELPNETPFEVPYGLDITPLNDGRNMD